MFKTKQMSLAELSNEKSNRSYKHDLRIIIDVAVKIFTWLLLHICTQILYLILNLIKWVTDVVNYVSHTYYYY